jgi:hypothetical protein
MRLLGILDAPRILMRARGGKESKNVRIVTNGLKFVLLNVWLRYI